MKESEHHWQREHLEEHSKYVRRRRREEHQRQERRDPAIQDGRADVNQCRTRPAQVPRGLGKLVGLGDVGLPGGNL